VTLWLPSEASSQAGFTLHKYLVKESRVFTQNPLGENKGGRNGRLKTGKVIQRREQMNRKEWNQRKSEGNKARVKDGIL
jgi:hypothetical protein